MHVIAGKYKGLKLEYDRPWIRPTTSKARAGYFSAIGNMIENQRFLDLFCGTGAMAIEALSRGASVAVGIDARIEVAKINKERLGLQQLELYRNEATHAITILEKKKDQFAIIFMDPPYAFPDTFNVLSRLSKSDILKEGGWLAVEHENNLTLPETIGRVAMYRRYKYGQSVITLYHDAKNSNISGEL